MKTAALITKHAAYNYGAVFQSYATQRAIESVGVKCEIIDYNTERGIEEKKLFSDFSSASNILHNVRNVFSSKSFFARKKNFCDFMDKYYHLSDKMYTKDDISSLPQDNYDFFITGSDQTFNLNLAGPSGIDEQKAYFWDFIENGNKIAFASSIGEHFGKITEEQKIWLKNQFDSYNSIAVREKVLAEYIEELTSKKVQVVIDPTFLLNTADWDKTSKPTKFDDDDFILFYTVMSEPWVIDYVKRVSRETGLKVLAPHPKNRFEMFGTGFERVDYYGPGEFLSLVKNAKLVIATSFHGTALAINYNKPLIPVVLGEGNRINTLLSLLGIQSLAVTKATQDKDYSNSLSIDYTFANKQIEEEKEKSIDYLKRAMNIE